MIRKYSISRDDGLYEAWPDVTPAPSGKLLCVFPECTHRRDRFTESDTGCSGLAQFDGGKF